MVSDSTIIIEPPKACTAAIIWLHGLGASADDFACLPQVLPKSITNHTRFVLPNAPIRPVTLNHGMAMPAWYDIASIDRTAAPDYAGLNASDTAITGLIDAEIDKGLLANRIILGGFSQGGAQTLYTGTKCTHQLGGLVGLSCYLPVPKIPLQPKKAPVLMMHGQLDPVVPVGLGESSADILQKHHYNIEFETYPIAHSVSDEEFTALGRWLSEKLG